MLGRLPVPSSPGSGLLLSLTSHTLNTGPQGQASVLCWRRVSVLWRRGPGAPRQEVFVGAGPNPRLGKKKGKVGS